MSIGEVQWTRSYSTCYRGEWPDYSAFRSRQHILPATEASDRIIRIPFQTAYSTCYRGEWPDYSIPDSIFYLLQRRVTDLFHSRQHILPGTEASDRIIPFQTAYFTCYRGEWPGIIPFQTAYFTCYRGEWPDYSIPDSIFYLLQRRVTGLFHSRQHILPATEASDRIIPFQTASLLRGISLSTR